MLNPLEGLLGLTRGARLAAPAIEALIPSGMGANAILRQVRAMGLHVQRSVGLALIRAYRGLSVSHDYVTSVRKTSRLNPSRIPNAPYITEGNWTHLIRIEGTDAFTGEDVIRYVNVTTNDWLTRGEAEAAALANIEGGIWEYALTDVSAFHENLTLSLDKYVAAVRSGEPIIRTR